MLQAHPFSLAHFKSSSRPSPARAAHVSEFHGHPFSPPLQHLGVIYRSYFASSCIPRATLLPRPLENFNVAMKRGRRTSLAIPTTIVLSCPFKYFEVAAFSSSGTNNTAQWTPVFSCPLKYVHPSLASSARCKVCAPGGGW